MNEPKVSVIVPVYKTEKYLCQCLDSILQQTLSDLEIIIVDEGDYDECRHIIDNYKERDGRVKGIHQKNGGYGASVNLGIDFAKGEYIGIVESDDFILSEMYEKLYEYAKRLDADVVKAPFYEFFDSVGSKKNILKVNSDCSYLSKHIPENKVFCLRESPCLMGGHASIWSGIYKRKYLRLNEIKFPEVTGGGYVDAVFRPQSLIYTDKIAWINQPYYCWRMTSEESTTNNYNLSALLQRWKEVHDLFQNKNELYEIVGPYSVDNEYGCTLALFYLMHFSEEQYQMLVENMRFNNNELIKFSPILSPRKKKEMLALKRDPVAFRKTIRNKQLMQCYLRPVLDSILPKGADGREQIKALYHRMCKS